MYAAGYARLAYAYLTDMAIGISVFYLGVGLYARQI